MGINLGDIIFLSFLRYLHLQKCKVLIQILNYTYKNIILPQERLSFSLSPSLLTSLSIESMCPCLSDPQVQVRNVKSSFSVRENYAKLKKNLRNKTRFRIKMIYTIYLRLTFAKLER